MEIQEVIQRHGILRRDFDGALEIIDRRISEDRRILGDCQYQVDRLQAHSGEKEGQIQQIRDYLLAIEAQLANVRDTGASALRRVHDEVVTHAQALNTLQSDRLAPRELDNRLHGVDPPDGQLRAELQALKMDTETTTNRLRTDATATSSDLYAKLRTVEQATAPRLDALEGVVPRHSDRIYSRSLRYRLPWLRGVLSGPRLISWVSRLRMSLPLSKPNWPRYAWR